MGDGFHTKYYFLWETEYSMILGLHLHNNQISLHTFDKHSISGKFNLHLSQIVWFQHELYFLCWILSVYVKRYLCFLSSLSSIDSHTMIS